MKAWHCEALCISPDCEHEGDSALCHAAITWIHSVFWQNGFMHTVWEVYDEKQSCKIAYKTSETRISRSRWWPSGEKCCVWRWGRCADCFLMQMYLLGGGWWGASSLWQRWLWVWQRWELWPSMHWSRTQGPGHGRGRWRGRLGLDGRLFVSRLWRLAWLACGGGLETLSQAVDLSSGRSSKAGRDLQVGQLDVKAEADAFVIMCSSRHKHVLLFDPNHSKLTRGMHWRTMNG